MLSGDNFNMVSKLSFTNKGTLNNIPDTSACSDTKSRSFGLLFAQTQILLLKINITYYKIQY